MSSLDNSTPSFPVLETEQLKPVFYQGTYLIIKPKLTQGHCELSKILSSDFNQTKQSKPSREGQDV